MCIEKFYKLIQFLIFYIILFLRQSNTHLGFRSYEQRDKFIKLVLDISKDKKHTKKNT